MTARSARDAPPRNYELSCISVNITLATWPGVNWSPLEGGERHGALLAGQGGAGSGRDCPILGSLGARGEGTGRRHHSKHDSFQKKLGDSVCEPFGSLEVDGMTDAFCHYHRDICSRGA